MSKASSRTMIYALLLSVVVHGIVLVEYNAGDRSSVQIDDSEITIQVEISGINAVASQVERHSKSEHRQTEKLVSSILAEVALSPAINEAEGSGEESGNAVASEQKQEIAASANGSEQLLGLLHQAINKHKRYPYQARRQHREGLVKLQFMMHPNGQVTDVSVVESSRFDVLDEAARKAVNAISPFQLAENYINERRIYDVDIDFRLN